MKLKFKAGTKWEVTCSACGHTVVTDSMLHTCECNDRRRKSYFVRKVVTER